MAKKKKRKSASAKATARQRKIKKVLKNKKPKITPLDLVHRTRIRVIGVGGGGGSIVSEIARSLKKVDFVVANTDFKALKEASKYTKVLQLGQKITGGLGCGMDARLGQKAAREDKAKIAKLFQGIDLCILVASLGGGAGSGAAPEFARIGREAGTMVFGIFTMPFKFEGGKKYSLAKNSLDKMIPDLNTVAVIPNENIFKIIDKKTPLKEALSVINRRLSENLSGLFDMIYMPGLINIDFADVRTILDGRGKLTYLNSAESQGPNRIEEVLKELLKSPLNDYDIKGAEKILFNITASQDIGMKEVEQISKAISDFNRRAKIIFGISQDNNYKDKIKISLLAVGCGRGDRPKPEPKRKPKKPAQG
ncbi:MAG: cell division protein FtsZ, partial [Patescibacteria group bacterium]